MNKRLALNTMMPFIEKIVVAVCGFIIPGLILKTYGSEVSGLVNSIAQFLSVISLLEFGMGAVVRSSLYKPLAEKDNKKTSEIVTAANKFFARLGNLLLIYVILLVFIYPYISKHDFQWIYTTTLILAISVSQFSQYYFGAVDTLLLMADQKGYIISIVQMVVTVLSTTISVIILKNGGSIHLLKIVTALIYLLKPIIYRSIVNKNYRISRKVFYNGEPIKQKWNGVAQHFTNYIFNSTDNITLTLFSSLSFVSIYSIYNLIVSQLRTLFYAFSGGFQDLLGELWAKKELEKVNIFFSKLEWSIHNITLFVFGCTLSLIVPFVQVYTYGVIDVNYTQPLFAFLLVFSYIIESLSLPYLTMILVAGHYKQTQNKFILTAVINVLISVVMVSRWNIVGVATGTLAAMIYRCGWMIIYASTKLNKWPLIKTIKQFLVDGVIVVVGGLTTNLLNIQEMTYLSWVLLAIQVAIIWGVVIICVNIVCYKNNVLSVLKTLRSVIKRV